MLLLSMLVPFGDEVAFVWRNVLAIQKAQLLYVNDDIITIAILTR